MVRYGARLFGWMFVTLGVCGIVMPLLPSAEGDAGGTSAVSVAVCLGLVALGSLVIWRTGRAG